MNTLALPHSFYTQQLDLSTPVENLPYIQIGQIGKTPLPYDNDLTGQTQTAVKAFIDNRLRHTPISDLQLRTVISYARYYINAPCWHGTGVEKLRWLILDVETTDELDAWLSEAIASGIDIL